MESPIRTAERFSIGAGRLRLGGAGAAGAPQPARVDSSTHMTTSGRVKNGSLRCMLSKPSSFFSWWQNRTQRRVKLRIFEVEARCGQLGRHDSLTLQTRVLPPFAPTQT